jgi:hypothetical protein
MKKTILALSLILLLSLFLINDVKAIDYCLYTFYFDEEIDANCNFEVKQIQKNGKYYSDGNNFYCEGKNVKDNGANVYSIPNNGTINFSLSPALNIEKFETSNFYIKMRESGSCPNLGFAYDKAHGVFRLYYNDLDDVTRWNENYDIVGETDSDEVLYLSDFKKDSKPNDKPNTDNKPSYNPYDDIVNCEGANAINAIPSCGCMPAAVADITSFIYGFLRIGGPVLLIILGGIDLGKAIVATDESGIKKAKKKLVNKFVAAACIFIVLSVIQMVVNITGGGKYSNLDKSNKNCLYYLLYGYES